MELIDAIRKAKRIYICGNGGSAANAMHIANDLILCGIRAHALTGDVATLTAIANDFGYEHVFGRQIEVFGDPGDLLIALSGSGNSPNIVKAIEMATSKGMDTFAITGAWQENQATMLAGNNLLAGTHMQDAEEAQLGFGHAVMRELKGLA